MSWWRHDATPGRAHGVFTHELQTTQCLERIRRDGPPGDRRVGPKRPLGQRMVGRPRTRASPLGGGLGAPAPLRRPYLRRCETARSGAPSGVFGHVSPIAGGAICATAAGYTGEDTRATQRHPSLCWLGFRPAGRTADSAVAVSGFRRASHLPVPTVYTGPLAEKAPGPLA